MERGDHLDRIVCRHGRDRYEGSIVFSSRRGAVEIKRKAPQPA
jgi:hypothetical protein